MLPIRGVIWTYNSRPTLSLKPLLKLHLCQIEFRIYRGAEISLAYINKTMTYLKYSSGTVFKDPIVRFWMKQRTCPDRDRLSRHCRRRTHTCIHVFTSSVSFLVTWTISNDIKDRANNRLVIRHAMANGVPRMAMGPGRLKEGKERNAIHNTAGNNRYSWCIVSVTGEGSRLPLYQNKWPGAITPGRTVETVESI